MTRQGNTSTAGLRRLRSLLPITALALVIVACGGGEAATPTNGDANPDTSAAAETPGTTSASSSEATTSGETTATEPASEPDPNAVLAPDFTLELGEGGEFVLSAETKPVYLVFWAEW